mgnify:CR=1 FL=1
MSLFLFDSPRQFLDAQTKDCSTKRQKVISTPTQTNKKLKISAFAGPYAGICMGVWRGKDGGVGVKGGRRGREGGLGATKAQTF